MVLCPIIYGGGWTWGFLYLIAYNTLGLGGFMPDRMQEGVLGNFYI